MVEQGFDAVPSQMSGLVAEYQLPYLCSLVARAMRGQTYWHYQLYRSGFTPLGLQDFPGASGGAGAGCSVHQMRGVCTAQLSLGWGWLGVAQPTPAHSNQQPNDETEGQPPNHQLTDLQ